MSRRAAYLLTALFAALALAAVGAFAAGSGGESGDAPAASDGDSGDGPEDAGVDDPEGEPPEPPAEEGGEDSPDEGEPPPDGRPDRYIVVLDDDVERARRIAKDHERRYGTTTKLVYEDALKGYAARVPEDRVEELEDDEDVQYVERDGEVESLDQKLPWGIDRIDADRSGTRAGDGSGSVEGVRAYVIDSGIDRSHPDLEVSDHVDFSGDEDTGCDEHGIHVAGTLAARDNDRAVVGVAPGAKLTDVRVLGCEDSGSTSKVIAGVDWVTAHAERPAVANLSLGGPPSRALDDAVRASAESGVPYAVAAGNDGEDACESSPARAGESNGVLTIAATNRADEETDFSNHGRCVDLWAPGAKTLSTGSGGGTETMAGTSVSAAHAAGTAALYLSSAGGDDAAGVEDALKEAARSTTQRSRDGRPIELVDAAGFGTPEDVGILAFAPGSECPDWSDGVNAFAYENYDLPECRLGESGTQDYGTHALRAQGIEINMRRPFGTLQKNPAYGRVQWPLVDSFGRKLANVRRRDNRWETTDPNGNVIYRDYTFSEELTAQGRGCMTSDSLEAKYALVAFEWDDRSTIPAGASITPYKIRAFIERAALPATNNAGQPIKADIDKYRAGCGGSSLTPQSPASVADPQYDSVDDQYYGEDGIARTYATYNTKSKYQNARYFVIDSTGVHGGGIVRGVVQQRDLVGRMDRFAYCDPNDVFAPPSTSWIHGRVAKTRMWGWFPKKGC